MWKGHACGCFDWSGAVVDLDACLAGVLAISASLIYGVRAMVKSGSGIDQNKGMVGRVAFQGIAVALTVGAFYGSSKKLKGQQ